MNELSLSFLDRRGRYCLAPRGSYLTAIAGPVRDHFLASAPAVVDEIWFDYNGLPLKWYAMPLFRVVALRLVV